MARPAGTYLDPFYARVLRAYCAETGTTQQALAAKLDVSREYLNRLLCRARPASAFRIKRIRAFAEEVLARHPSLARQAIATAPRARDEHQKRRELTLKFSTLTVEQQEAILASIAPAL